MEQSDGPYDTIRVEPIATLGNTDGLILDDEIRRECECIGALKRQIQ
jgi:hypothetical protein